MKLFKNYIFASVLQMSTLFLMIFLCYKVNAGDIDGSHEIKLHVTRIDCKKIMAHEHYVAYAQKRYRYIKPLLTACGLSFVLTYFWYTSAALSSEEIHEIKNIIADHKIADNKKQNPFEKDWFKFRVSSIGGVAVELIGGALLIPPLSDLIGKLTGSAHIMSSLELYDKEYTRCNALITQLARDMQMNLTSQAAGKQIAIGPREIVIISNRLLRRIEKLLGFMRVTLRKFPNMSLRQEAKDIEKRFVYCANELCNDLECLINKSMLDSEAALALIVQFAQRYAQEMQRFSFLEQDARESIRNL